jgi:hypothetical protein
MRVLLCAPYVGEIGWELLAWQARVRWHYRQGRYDRLIVLGAAGKAGFYADMPLEYREVDLRALPGVAYEDRRCDGGTRAIIGAEEIQALVEPLVAEAANGLREAGHDVATLWPAYAGKLWPCDAAHQQFVRFRRPMTETPPAPWVVMVQRARTFQTGNNYPPQAWDELAAILQSRGVHATVYPCDSEAAIRDLSGCDLAVGYSTGGLHLASLCGCPHLVWAGEDARWTPWSITNRQRYETFWNPLGTPVAFHGCDSHPEPAMLADWTMGVLGSIGRRTGSAWARAGLRTVWQLRSWLVSRVIHAQRMRHWPWRVQQWVRYGLV